MFLRLKKLGTNVTELIAKLNNAANILAEAENNYKNQNVTSQLESVRFIANGVNNDALALRDAAVIRAQDNFWLTAISSAVGAAVFSLSLVLIWRRIKRNYKQPYL